MPEGWADTHQDIICAAKLAVETNVYPLYQVIEGTYVLGKSATKPLPVSKYLKTQGRFKHLGDEQVAVIQREVDKRFDDLKWMAPR